MYTLSQKDVPVVLSSACCLHIYFIGKTKAQQPSFCNSQFPRVVSNNFVFLLFWFSRGFLHVSDGRCLDCLVSLVF